MDRTEEIFCKMLTYNKQDLGVTESPYFITEDILKRGLSAGQPIEPGERDRLRAETLRKEFLRMPQLNLDAQVD